MSSHGAVGITLENGFRGRDGTLHRDVVLRPATVRDELRALADFRVHLRPECFSSVALARTIDRLGTLETVDVGVLERLSAEDTRLLVRAYRELNGYDGGGAAG